MMDRLKRFLNASAEVFAMLLVLAGGIAYIAMTGLTLTFVINELRLDTYIGIGTGVEIVMLIFLLVWVPALALRATRSSSKRR